MYFYKKLVTTITIFFAGVSGVFLLSGAGTPGLRILVGLIFFVSFLNLSIYMREFGRWSKKVIQAAGTQLAASGKTEDKKPGPGEPGQAKPAEGGSRRPVEADSRAKEETNDRG